MTKRYIGSSRRVTSLGQQQWAPTLTAHDPNPPIPLEDAPLPNAIAPLTSGYTDVLKDTDLESDVTQVYGEAPAVNVEVILSVYDPNLTEQDQVEDTAYSFVVDAPQDGPIAVWLTEEFAVTSDPEEAYLSLVFEPEPATPEPAIITGYSSEEEELEKLEQYVSNVVYAEAPAVPAEDPIKFSAEVSEAGEVVELEGSELSLLYDDAPAGDTEAVLVLHFDDESPGLEQPLESETTGVTTDAPGVEEPFPIGTVYSAELEEQIALLEAELAGVFADPPAPEEVFPIGTTYSADLEEEIGLLEAELAGVFEDAPPPPDPAPILSDPVAAEPIEEVKPEEYGSFMVHAEAPVIEEQDALIDVVVSDDPVYPDTEDSVTLIHLEDGDTAVLTIELDDPVSMELEPAEISYFFEDAPVVTSVMRVWIGRGAVVGTGMRTFIKG